MDSVVGPCFGHTVMAGLPSVPSCSDGQCDGKHPSQSDGAALISITCRMVSEKKMRLYTRLTHLLHYALLCARHDGYAVVLAQEILVQYEELEYLIQASRL